MMAEELSVDRSKIFSSSRWFNPYVTSSELEELFRQDGRDGLFGVRRSQTNPADFVLSVWRNNQMTNIKIFNHGDYYDPSIGELFGSLSDLVAHFYKNPNELKEKNGDWIHLKIPYNFDEPTEERWFHGSISSAEAEKLLQESKVEGSFLLRRSISKIGSYVISALVKTPMTQEYSVFHIMVHHTNGKYHLQGGDAFDSLEQLVEHYKRWSMVDNSGVVVLLKVPINTTRVNLKSFEKRKEVLESKESEKKDGFSEEFEFLQQQEMRISKERKQGGRPENKAKNRYKNILPFDDTRVKLETGVESDGSDYINANHIIIPENTNKYIATQGTLSTTCKDFWQMVWQMKSICIFMVTKEVERGKNKCYKYWPASVGTTDTHGLYNITLDKEFTDENFVIRKLTLGPTKSTKRRQVTQFQYIAWPDHGVPNDPGPCIQGIKDVNSEMEIFDKTGKERPPIIVHCSAGIGRSGTVIVLDRLINLIDQYGLCVDIDIQNTIGEIRSQRSGMVQTAAQYKFIYDAISQYMSIYEARQKAKEAHVDSEYGNIPSLR